MTLSERIKKLRKDLDLTQAEFGEKIGSTQNAIGNYETGHRNPSSSVINNICKTFDVSEKWLRTGDGEMFLAKPTAALDALAVEHRLSNGDYVLIEKFLALKPETRKTMTDYMREVVASITAMEREGSLADDPAFPSTLSHGIPRTMEEVDEQADSFRSGLIMDARHQRRQDAAHTPTIEEQARAEAEEYYRQILAEKERAARSPASPDDTGGSAPKMA